MMASRGCTTYCSQRYYDPATASFITKDPAKADGKGSAYQYCGGDPVGQVDPSGLRIWKFGWYLKVCRILVGVHENHS
jgi:RHS repeat-associated protein